MEPQGAPGQYSSFLVRQPRATHTRPATCEEYQCPARLRGWESVLNEGDAKQAEAARWIRKASHREFVETRREDGMTVFTFTPGQDCFASGRHRVLNDRPAALLIARGDYRDMDRPQVAGVSEWTGRLGESIQQIADIRQRG